MPSLELKPTNKPVQTYAALRQFDDRGLSTAAEIEKVIDALADLQPRATQLQTALSHNILHSLMVPLFQLFEFSYPDGFLFYDRSGALARRLQETFPGLLFKTASLDQRDFVLPAEDLDLFFGIAISRIQTMSPGQQEFSSAAASFLQIVTEVLEVSQLKDFHFRYVLGKPCNSDEEAQKLMWPLVPDETKAKLHSLAEPRKWQALQGEFLVGNLACQSRIAIIDLVPHPKLVAGKGDAGKTVPHITFHVDFRGLAPIAVAEFDAKAFMTNVRESHAREILAKLAPHLS